MRHNQRFSLEQAIERNPLIVTPHTPLIEVVQLMSQGWGRICHLSQNDLTTDDETILPVHSSFALVMQESQIVGIFTERDMVRLIAAGRILKNTTIAEVMSQEVVTLQASEIEDVFTILSLTCDRKIRHLPILDENNQLLGVITTEGMRRALHPTEWLRFRRVEEVMNTQIIHAPATVSVLDTIKLMVEHHVSCVVIVNEISTSSSPSPPSPSLLIPIGIITERDILQFQKIDDDGSVKYIIATGIDITEKHQIEEDLNRFFSLSLDVFCVGGFDGYFKQVNPAFKETLGYEKDELFAQPFLSFIHPDDVAATLAEMDKISQGVKTIAFENRYRTKDGSYKWMQWNATPYEQLFYAVARDVTERKQMQLDIQESEKRYRYIYENTPVMLHSIDSNGKLISVSNFWLEKLGYKRHEVLGHKSTEFLTPESQKYARQVLPDYFDKGFCQNIPYQFIRKDEKILDVLLSAIAERDSNGNIIRSLAVLIDVTESNKAKQKIQEQATLLDVATDAIMVRGLDNQILFWNQGAERLYGFTSAEALGKNANELLYRDSLVQLEEIHQALFKSDYWKGELQQVTKDGNDIIVFSTWNLVRDEHGNHKSTLIVNTDITEKKQLEAQFLRAQRLESIGTLSGGIAHDLNNILTPILAISQLLPLKLPTVDEQTQHFFNILETSAKRGATLVKQVLSFARGVQGKRTPLQVKHIISEIREFARNTFPKSIEIQVGLPDNLRLISADATQIHQVLMNLCVNARDAMPHGGTLSIKAENIDIDENYTRMNFDASVGNYVLITVSDTGTGIEKETLERIFEPFFTTKEQGKGTGLGLSTTIGIIKSHGGFIKVDSEVGQGTKFQVYLPASQTVEIVGDEQNEIPLGNGELILIVDDETSIRDITKASLERYNYQVLTASDGIEAIALYAQNLNEISAVLMDMMMPEMDGVTSIRTLLRINPQVKIIAVSGLATSDRVSAARNNGAKLFLPKPYTSEELLRQLHQVLNA